MYQYRPLTSDDAERGAHYLRAAYDIVIDPCPFADEDTALLNMATAAADGNTEAHLALAVYLRALRGARIDMGLAADTTSLQAA